MTLTDRQIVTVCAGAGFANVPSQFQNAGLTWAVAIVLAESGGDPLATNTIGNSAGTDRGLFQINSVYHSEYSDAVCFSATGNAGAAFVISSQGQNFGPWSSFHNGQAGAQFARATAAVAAGGEPYLGGSGPVGASTTPTGGIAVDASNITVGVSYQSAFQGGDITQTNVTTVGEGETSTDATSHISDTYSLADTYFPALYAATVNNTTGANYSSGDVQNYMTANNVGQVEVLPHGTAVKTLDQNIPTVGYQYLGVLSGSPNYPPDGHVKLYLFQQVKADLSLQAAYQTAAALGTTPTSNSYQLLQQNLAAGRYIQYDGASTPVVAGAFLRINNVSTSTDLNFTVDLLDVTTSGQYALTRGGADRVTATPAWWGPSLQGYPPLLSIPGSALAPGATFPLGAAVLARLLANDASGIGSQPIVMLWTTEDLKAGGAPAFAPVPLIVGTAQDRFANISYSIYIEVRFPRWRIGSIAPNCQTATAPPDTPSSLAISGLEKHQTIFEPHGPVMR